MSCQIMPGDEFWYYGIRWVCLEQTKNRLIALDPVGKRIETIEVSDRLKQIHSQWNDLMSQIGMVRKSIQPGTYVAVNNMIVLVKKVCLNGTLLGEIATGIPVRVDRWAPFWLDFLPSSVFLPPLVDERNFSTE